MQSKTGIELISEERQEQIEKHGYNANHDLQYDNNELRQAAMFCMTLNMADYPDGWEWFYEKCMDKKSKMSAKDFRIEMNKIAGAFLAADIDYILNLTK